jgi:hypothetical protein
MFADCQFSAALGFILCWCSENCHQWLKTVQLKGLGVKKVANGLADIILHDLAFRHALGRWLKAHCALQASLSLSGCWLDHLLFSWFVVKDGQNVANTEWLQQSMTEIGLHLREFLALLEL